MDAKERDWLLKEKYNGVESDAFHADLERLKQGEPLAYVIGFSMFLGCKIDLSEHTLIPRTETEFWVEKALNELQVIHGKDAHIQVLDVFSGSGCIGLAVLKRFPNSVVHFADIDVAAITQIQKNAELNRIDPSRYTVFSSDVFSGLPAGVAYDAIFANPPYIAYKDEDRIDKSVLDHEPHAALFSGESGYELIDRTFCDAKKFLNPDGRVYLECDDIQKEGIESILSQSGLKDVSFNDDQYGLFRWVSATA